jgi:hypothetical protein
VVKGAVFTRTRRPNILVVSNFDGNNANVIRDFLFSFRAHSQYRYYYIFDTGLLNQHVDFSRFDVILIFWSSYLLAPEWTEGLRERIRKTAALKVLFLQDEYRDVRQFNHVMAELGIQLIFTCVAEKDHETFYPRSLIPSLEGRHTVLPGYVPSYLEGLRGDRSWSRSVDLGYRSRAVPYYLGDLGQEKQTVAERFQEISLRRGFRSDISVREEDRLYGKDWLDFLRSSRCVLGSSSGASVIDFTGDIRKKCELFLAVRPNATYAEVKQRFFADVDWKIIIDTVSPRVFEAAALLCTLVHHEGGYGGVLRPEEHYICVRRDYSNIEDVIDRIKDDGFCRRLAENAHRDLVASGRYSYSTFARWFDGVLAKHIGSLVGLRSVSTVMFYGRNYLQRDQGIVPYRERFLRVPTLPRVCVSTGGIRIGSRLRGSVVGRFVSAPGEFLVKARLAWRVVLSSAFGRRMLVHFLRDRGSWREVGLYRLVHDLLRFEILFGNSPTMRDARRSFRITAGFEIESRTLTLTSSGHRAANSGSLAAGEVERAEAQVWTSVLSRLQESEVRLIVWDHSAVGVDMVYPDRRPTSIGLGSDGVYRFEALPVLFLRFPARVGLVLDFLRAGGIESASIDQSEPG